MIMRPAEDGLDVVHWKEPLLIHLEWFIHLEKYTHHYLLRHRHQRGDILRYHERGKINCPVDHLLIMKLDLSNQRASKYFTFEHCLFV